ncbi:MAG: DHH family phosphoesterase [bacterium]
MRFIFLSAISEGYGLNLTAIKQFAESGVKLIITVDLGITAVEEVAQATVDGMDVIITDHHLPPANCLVPSPYSIRRPTIILKDALRLGRCFQIPFKFAQGFIKKYGEYFKIKAGAEKWMLDMAGLGTLSDMVPLTGENRTIAHFGMKVHAQISAQRTAETLEEDEHRAAVSLRRRHRLHAYAPAQRRFANG